MHWLYYCYVTKGRDTIDFYASSDSAVSAVVLFVCFLLCLLKDTCGGVHFFCFVYPPLWIQILSCGIYQINTHILIILLLSTGKPLLNDHLSKLFSLSKDLFFPLFVLMAMIAQCYYKLCLEKGKAAVPCRENMGVYWTRSSSTVPGSGPTDGWTTNKQTLQPRSGSAWAQTQFLCQCFCPCLQWVLI